MLGDLEPIDPIGQVPVDVTLPTLAVRLPSAHLQGSGPAPGPPLRRNRDRRSDADGPGAGRLGIADALNAAVKDHRKKAKKVKKTGKKGKAGETKPDSGAKA